MSSDLLSSSVGASAAPEIVPESKHYAERVEALFDRAFGPGRHAKTADRLREHNELFRHLSRVAVVEDGIVGAVRVWPVLIGANKACVFIGPVAVDADYRGGSLGLALTQSCLDAAAEAGIFAAVLIGDAPYFSRVGFEQVSTQKIQPPGYVPEGRLLVKLLSDVEGVEGVEGRISVPPATMPT